MSKPITALEILEKYKKPVWNEAKKYLKDPAYPASFKVSSNYKRLQEFHWSLVNDYPQRKGKYLRPALVVLTYQALGGKLQKAIKTAAAMQISEEWLLIHDDFEDGSWERRGKPTLHRIHGPELAVNAGDALQVIMWKILIDNHKVLGLEKSYEIIDEFYKMLTRTTIGQTAEIKWAIENKVDFSDEDWFFIADGKTSYYTISGPMRLGAIMAGVTKKQLDSLTTFGLYLGRCFQLVDDILDITSDFGGLKKQKGNDIYEGKRTIILGHLLRTVGKEDRKRLVSILSLKREEKTEKDIAWVMKRMNDCGSIDYAKMVASKLKNKAFSIFSKDLKFLSNESARGELESLTHFVLERDH